VPGPGVRRKRTALRDRSAGKGTSSSEARAGALGEAIERYSAVWQGDEARVRSTWRALEHEGRRAVHPDSLQLYSARQYAGRDAWNSRTSAFHQVPVRFDENRACDWTPVWSLTGHHTVHVPTGALYYHYPHPPGQAFIRADSNGSAAGGTLEEAVLHGLLELIERDSVALWWYNRVQRPQVSAQGATADWQNEHARLGRRAWVLDLTSDLGVPVAAAVSCGTGHDPHPGEHILMGFGAGLDMRAAVAKAMNEANQLLAAADGSAPAGRAGVDPAVTDWWRTAALADHPYLAPLPEEHARAAARAPESGAEPPRDMDGLLQTMERHSLEVLVADQTRPDIGLPVVKVLVPGLRHFWPRYAPGRLYDVPVHLGWLAAPTAEEDLNPLGMFL
jgi:ribosomal protein S12 methylthiotransferase accessory factor